MPAAAATATDDAKTTTKQSCKVWLCRPATMDVGRLSNLKSKTQQKMLWLIHRLTGLHVWFADKDWIQLPSQSIKRVLGRNYHRVIEIAVSLGFIEFKKSYLA